MAGPAQAQAAPQRIEDADTEVIPAGLGLGNADIGAFPGPVRFEGIFNGDVFNYDIAARRRFENADTEEFARIPTQPAEAPASGGTPAPEPSSATQAPESSGAAGGRTFSGVILGGIIARHAPIDGDARRLWPAAIGYILIAALALIVFVRHPHRFAWGSAWGIVYLIILGMMLLAGLVGLARGLLRATRRPASVSRTAGGLLAADVRARKSAGTALLESPRVHVAAAARAPLADGSVDSRALVTLAMLAAIHPLDIDGFGAAGHSASTGAPLRTADINWAAPPGDRRPASLHTLRAILSAQRPPYLPSSIQTVKIAPDRIVLRVTYPAPSPLGLLGSRS